MRREREGLLLSDHVISTIGVFYSGNDRCYGGLEGQLFARISSDASDVTESDQNMTK